MKQSNNIDLKPIMEPAPVSFSFDTIGWKILFALIIVLLVYLLYKYYQNYQKNRYRRDAVLRIVKLNNNKNIELSDFIKQIMFQLKQTALETFGRNKVASLEGDNWLLFLKESGKNTDFSPYKEDIAKAVYQDNVKVESHFNKENFTELSIKWIKKHAR